MTPWCPVCDRSHYELQCAAEQETTHATTGIRLTKYFPDGTWCLEQLDKPPYVGALDSVLRHAALTNGYWLQESRTKHSCTWTWVQGGGHHDGLQCAHT